MSDSRETSTPRLETKAEREEGMGGLAKGLAIIESFTERTPQLSVSEAAVASGTTPAAARRCLRTLEELGYLSYDGKYYRPTPRMMRLPHAYADSDTLPVLARPRLAALRDAFNESASLAVLDGDHALFVARAETTHMASTGMRVGARVPAPYSGSGRVMLAALDDDAVELVLQRVQGHFFTERTPRTIKALRDRIIQARAEGYSSTDEELALGVRAIAAPVVDISGATRAAITVSALAARISMEEMLTTYLPVLLAEAAALGKRL